MTQLPPLSERVSAPASAPHPADADGVLWRAATVDDVDALVNLHQAMDPIDHSHYITPREEIAQEFAHSYVNPATDSLIGLDERGRAVAYGFSILSPGQESLVRGILFGGVHPDRRGRGLGRQVLAWQEQRGLQHLAGSDKTLPGWLLGFADERASRALRLFERAGFETARYFLELRRDLADPIRAVALPEGVRVIPWDAGWTDRALEAKNAAFRDHWGSQPATAEQWESSLALSTFRPDLTFLAVARGDDGDEEVAAFLFTDVNEEDWAAQGYRGAYIGLVGVVREWRGNRLAQALLARALAAYRDLGYEKANLDVDSDSPTGALGLYSGMGFVPATRSVSFVKTF